MVAAIRVEGLGKRYHVGQGQQRRGYRTLRETLSDFALAPFRCWHAAGTREQDRTEFWALNDVSFEVQPGEVVGIIGRNGAGKSTLLKILSQITKPTKGEIELRGRVGSLLEVGTGFHAELTGRENIYLNGSILGMSRREIDRRFDEIVAFAEVEKFLDTPVKRYSSGMYVRLAFAVAAHLEPEILIVDEVLAVGDAAFQKKCLGKMEEVAKGGRTVLFVSHNTTALLELCQRGVVIVKGKLDFDGSIRASVEHYLSDALPSGDGVYDLTEHLARSKAYNPLIRRVTLQGENGRPSSRFPTMSAVAVRIELDSPTRITDPRLAVAVEDQLGRRLFTLASYFEPAPLPPVEGRQLYECIIPQLPLGEGRYLISVSIGTPYAGLLDSVDGAGWFDVIWDNNYRSGEPYYPVYGPIITSAKWQYLV